MKVNIDIQKKEVCGVKALKIQEVAERTLHLSQKKFLSESFLSFSLVEVSLKEMRRVNKLYRKKDAPTDVLSFAEYTKKELEEVSSQKKEIFLGDILLCREIVEKQAQEDGVSVERELVFLFSHGILHLLGFRHSPKMFAIQQSVCDWCCTREKN